MLLLAAAGIFAATLFVVSNDLKRFDDLRHKGLSDVMNIHQDAILSHDGKIDRIEGELRDLERSIAAAERCIAELDGRTKRQ